jgi:hypothetical protein
VDKKFIPPMAGSPFIRTFNLTANTLATTLVFAVFLGI